MNNQISEEKQRERKKNIGGMVLALVVFGWFLFYLLSHIPK